MPSIAPNPTPERLMQFVFGFAPPMIIETALRLDVFEALENGSKTVDELAMESGAAERGLRIVLNALVGLELLTKDDQGRYALTAESAAFLVKGNPTFQGAFFLLTGEPMFAGWRHLHEIVRRGRPAHHINQEGEGVPFFLRFVEDIFSIHYPAAARLAEALAISDAGAPLSVLDLAAGSGVWSIALAERSPQVHVTAIDWEGMLAVTRKVTARQNVADRYRFIGGDLHEADFGSGYAIATLGHIIHSEGEQRSRQLLRKTFDALAPGGTIAIAEILVNADRRGPLPALIFAANMLVNSDEGNTFSLEEISAWLRDAGFEDIRTIDAPGLAPLLILATKPRS